MRQNNPATRGVINLLVILVGVSALSLPVYGELNVTSVTGKKKITPGEFVSLVFSVENRSGETRDVEFELTVPDGWAPMGTPSTASLGKGKSDTIFVTVQVPATAKAGDYSVELGASYNSEVYTGTATVVVEEIKGVSLRAPREKSVTKDTVVSYVFTVKNTGNVTDTFKIEAESDHEWATEVTADSVHLFPGSAKDVEISLSVPEDAEPGRDRIVVSATSTRDDDIVDKKSVYTRILPPSPQAVGGELYAILPARLEGTFNRSISGGSPTGTLNLIGDGELGHGNLYFDLGLSDLYSNSNVELNDFDFEEDNYEVNIGDVGAIFSDFLSMYGRGIYLNLTEGNFGLSVLDISPDLTKGGASLSYQREGLYLSANLISRETEEGRSTYTESLLGRFTRFDAGELEWEAGYTPSEGEYGQAYRGYAEAGFDLINLEGEAFFVGPRFGGASSGNKGFRLSESSSGENYRQNIDYSYYYRPPTNVQTKSTLLTDRLYADLTLDFLGATGFQSTVTGRRKFRLFGSATFTNRKDTRDDPTLDETRRAFRGALFYSYKGIEFSLSAREVLRTNNLSEETYESFSLDHEFGFTHEGVSFTAGFTSRSTQNLTTDQSVSSSGITSFELATTGAPYLSLSVTNSDQSMDVQMVGTVTPSTNLEFSLSSSAYVTNGDLDFEGSLEFTYEYDLPLEFIITKGRIDGYVFVDEDGDGQKGKEEPGVPGIVVTVKNSRVATGKNGYYRLQPFKTGTYEVSIDDLPSEYGLEEKLPKTVQVTKGEVTTVAIPVTELSRVAVGIYEDANQDGKHSSGEKGVSGVGVTLKGDGIDKSRFTKKAGEMIFRGLAPGSYTLILDKNTFPPRSQITDGKPKTKFNLAGGEVKELEIGIYQEPREIIFGQPPEADFGYIPDSPKVGAIVSFSGGLSSDPDGEITKYEWDFQSDGEIDRSDKIVSWKFEKPGSYDVTLTVTDNEGNQATVTKTLEVVAKSS